MHLDVEKCRRLMGYSKYSEVVLHEHGFTVLCYCRDTPSSRGGFRMLISGEVYPNTSNIRTDSLCGSVHNLHDMLHGDGNYALACIYTDSRASIAFARDPLGSRPLYYQHDSNGVVVASDRRVLDDGLEVEPGTLYVFEHSNMESTRFSPLVYEPYTAMDTMYMDGVIERTRHLIIRSLRLRLAGRSRVVAGVSGIDSIILALLSERISSVVPVTVCTRGSYDEINANYIRDRTGLDIHVVVLDEGEILTILDELYSLNIDLDFTDAMDLSIACVVYALARFARDDGADAIMLGQLADELFGGYARYMRHASIYGLDSLNLMLFNDVKNARHDLCRDVGVASSMMVDVVLPYASTDLASYVTNLPAELKVDIKHGVRKLLLRRVAESMGLAGDVVYREKKAMQFSTGIFRIVKGLLRDGRIRGR
ncbi:MAG: asparagine synthase-related protein [Candidatus Nitrosocaldus sp.]|nr:asparagine synthase-related protein [Candidatus Nitrosocaldus sp.]MDW7999505.1 asparagine synthase-related protein [Candidatus Nitrosocaldus sp.]